TGAAPTTFLHEWQPGGSIDLGGSAFLIVKGQYAIFTSGFAMGSPLVRRDVVAGVNAIVANTFQSTADVAANGDVVYVRSSNVFRFRNGVSAQLTNDADGKGSPITDGVN